MRTDVTSVADAAIKIPYISRIWSSMAPWCGAPRLRIRRFLGLAPLGIGSGYPLIYCRHEPDKLSSV
jgi:hypothetical protein